MTKDELYLNIHGVSFDQLVCQTNIQTEADKEYYQKQGYSFLLTEEEYSAMCDVPAEYIWYSPSVSQSSFYYNPTTFAVAQFHISLLLLDDDVAQRSKWIEGVKKVIAQSEEYAAQNNFHPSVFVLPDNMRFEYLRRLTEQRDVHNIPGFYTLFLDAYNDSDYGFSTVDNDLIQKVVSCKTAEDIAKTEAALASLPDMLTVYRGGNSKSTAYDKAFSWTLDINIANLFAARRGHGPAYIAEGRVAKEKVIECLLRERNEQELLVNPADVEIVQVTDVQGLDFLRDVLNRNVYMYREYIRKMDHLHFAHNSEIHGRAHEGRVMLLCLIIADMLKLPASDKKILATAAIYHDTQRLHDGDDAEHGAESMRYYNANEKHPIPIVEFLCEYHSRPDEQGYSQIMADRQLSKERTRVTRLFNIFKDADALDRIRLGMGCKLNELDMNQLRLDVSKQLTLVARLTLENLKI